MEQEWEKILNNSRETMVWFPDGAVFIGGVAVYLHSYKKNEGLLEISHDADFYLSLRDFADLRDLEEVTANRRLQKHQFIKNGCEFDVYVERNNSLSVHFDDIMKHSTVIDGIRVAALEHLLVLKINAYMDRKASAKGGKDLRDIIKIIITLDPGAIKSEILNRYLAIKQYDEITKETDADKNVFLTLVGGNKHEASKLCERFKKQREHVAGILRSQHPHPDAENTPSGR